MATFRVISIGTLAAHPLWNERSAVRTGHATTTLITTRAARILVNPALPPAAVAARLHERSGLQPDSISHVFLTSFDAEHARGLPAFENATWLAHEPELDHAAAVLQRRRQEAQRAGDADLIAAADAELHLLQRCRPAPDQLAEGVDLFPLPGVTPGLCALLLPQPRGTVLVCGDAIATSEHLAQRKLLPSCSNLQQAMESFGEAVEIAEVLVLGRDNVTINPHR